MIKERVSGSVKLLGKQLFERELKVKETKTKGSYSTDQMSHSKIIS